MATSRWSIILLVVIIFLAGCKIQIVEKKNVSEGSIIEEIESKEHPSAPIPTPAPAQTPSPPPSMVSPSPPSHPPPPPPAQARTGPSPEGPPALPSRPASTLPYQPPTIKTGDTSSSDARLQLSVGEVRVHLLDVGDAESILVESGKTMLIDCGSEDFGKKTITYLHGQGIDVIDILLLSNFERERIGACEDILYEFDVKRIIQNDLVIDDAAYKRIEGIAEEQGIGIERLFHDRNFTLDANIDVELHVPYDKGSLSEMQSHVIVTRLVHGGVSFLFMGDCGKGCERIFHENMSLDYAVTVYGIGAHAEQKSATRLLFYNLSADVGLLSANRSLRIEQADLDVVKRYTDHGLRVYRTDYDGDIVITSNGQSYDINVSKGIEHWKEGTTEDTMRTPSPDCPFVAHVNSIFYYTFDCPLAKMVEPQWKLCFADDGQANATGRKLDSRCR